MDDIHKHGVSVGKNKSHTRVQCNHCSKQMTSFTRLKYHLGGVGTDVTSCDQVAFPIRETYRNMLLKDGPSATTKRVKGVQTSNRNKRVKIQDSTKKSVTPPQNRKPSVEANKDNLSSNKIQKSIARFCYENCVDFSVVDSVSFREMMSVVNSSLEGGGKFPDSNDLKGMFQETLKEVQDHVKKVKDSWAVTGCSILLDAWVDQNGRDLVTFIADSPAGPIYLNSFNVSDVKTNTNALTSLLDELVNEVGVRNVVQIIACTTSGWVGELGKAFAANNQKVFWSVSISHCFELMFTEIAKLDSFKDVLAKVDKITEFIKDYPAVWNLFKDLGEEENKKFSSSSVFEFVTPYLTIERILKSKKNLVEMFASAIWNKEDGAPVSKLVKDSSFWVSVERVVKATSPLIRNLLTFSTGNTEHLGYVYDSMDEIKENIAKEFDHKVECYKPLWDVIDEVWNKHLHSPLHVTGYFLNPTAFYSTDFNSDPEVTTGFISSLVRLVKECDVQAQISTQLQLYTLGKDCFDEASQAKEITGIHPTDWWAEKASKHPEIQSFAIKILSQTCEGPARYKMKRNLAEKMLSSEGMSCNEKKHLEELVFVHFNLHLQSCKAKLCEE